MTSYPQRMYHPDLEPPHNECEALDDRQAAVYAEAGWLPAPEPEAKPGYQPEPVRYEPVKAAAKKSAAKKSESTTD